MFFVLSKVVGFLAIASNVLAMLMLIGVLLLMLKRFRLGRALLIVTVSLTLIIGYSPVSNLVILPLSERFPEWRDDGRGIDGIVVLGGSIDADQSRARGTTEMNAGGERILTMLELARRYPAARVVYSGGSGNLVVGDETEAPIAGELLDRFGVSADRVILDSASRNTAENAKLAYKLSEAKPGERWLLVTSAYHMPRAVGAFRAVGFTIEPYPVDWRSNGWSAVNTPFHFLSMGLGQMDIAVREWVGLLAYRLAGHIDVIFPGPDDNSPERHSAAGKPSR